MRGCRQFEVELIALKQRNARVLLVNDDPGTYTVYWNVLACTSVQFQVIFKSRFAKSIVFNCTSKLSILP
jgi:hypothetical protein